MQDYVRMDIPKDFTVESVADFRLKIRDYMYEGKINFVFNFSKCDFIDSTGLGALPRIWQRRSPFKNYGRPVGSGVNGFGSFLKCPFHIGILPVQKSGY